MQDLVFYKAHIYRDQEAPRRWVIIFAVTKALQMHEEVHVINQLFIIRIKVNLQTPFLKLKRTNLWDLLYTILISLPPL